LPEENDQHEQTNSKDSSSNSAPSSQPPSTKGSGRPRAKKDQDLPAKLVIADALATNGYYVRINVGLSATTARGLADVTDVDVLGMRYDITFTPSAIAVSCKSGEARSQSPAKEIFYLRGVLDYVHAHNGVVAFTKKPIPHHLRDLGRQLDILVLSRNEVDNWCESLKNGLPAPHYFEEPRYDQYEQAWTRTQGGLSDYLQTDYWFHFDFRNLQNLIVHLRKLTPKLNGQEPWHAIVFLDAAAHFCLTLFDLCRQIRLLGEATVTETTAAYLFGGAPSFKARRDLYTKVQQLLSSTGVLSPAGPTLPPLEPPYAAALAELAIRCINRPQAATLIPQILQDTLWRTLGATGTPPHEDTNYLAAEKLAQDLIDFLKVATGAAWSPKI
jgi:hypothetical protein